VNEPKSTRYHRLSRRVAVSSVAAGAAVLLAMTPGGGSFVLRNAARVVSGAGVDAPSTVAVYVVLLALLYQVVRLPLTFYGTFLLDRRYGLSSESLGRWAVDHLKAAALLVVLALGAAEVIYLTIRWWPRAWWLASAACVIAALAGLARIAPTVLLPIFYRFKPLDRESLRDRLVSLCARAKVPVMGAYVWSLGDRTRRANAALVGTGSTRRILLSDTLLQEYSDDEIEVIIAHELGHHAHGDIARGLLVEAVVLTLGFAVAAALLRLSGARLGLHGPADVAGLPLLILGCAGVSLLAGPILKAMSRRNERRADAFALSLTGRPDAFVSAMRRLGAQNLAEEQPSRSALWLFHTHPALRERVDAAREFAAR
jgi:Zn-dependent protease with chaperone function